MFNYVLSKWFLNTIEKFLLPAYFYRSLLVREQCFSHLPNQDKKPVLGIQAHFLRKSIEMKSLPR